MTDWWQDLFDEKYEKLFAEARPPLRTAQEVEGLQALLRRHGVPSGGQVLDLGCGYGRTAVPLAQAGYRLTGLDLSAHLLSRARQVAAEGEAAVEWVEGDMRELPAAWQDRFDAVISVFTAFGYFDNPAENERVLTAVHDVLKPGGVFIIDVANRDGIMANYRATDWYEVNDILVCITRQFDPVTGMNHEFWLWSEESGRRDTISFRSHIYTATDLGRMLRGAGLEPAGYYGQLAAPPDDHTLEPFDSRLVIAARKTAAGDATDESEL